MAKFRVKQLESRFKFNKRISSDSLLAAINIYYCQEGREAMCLMKDLVFEVPLEKSLDAKPRDLVLQYRIP